MWTLQTSIKLPKNIQCVNMSVHKKGSVWGLVRAVVR